MTIPPPDCRCAVCGFCYHDHGGWEHDWESRLVTTPQGGMTTPPYKDGGLPGIDTSATPWVPLVELRLPVNRELRKPPAEAAKAPILVDTATAAFAAGRDEKVIYRWANEGRLTRHGTAGKGNARWDIREIPAWDGPDSGTPRPAPPGVKPKNFQDRA